MIRYIQKSSINLALLSIASMPVFAQQPIAKHKKPNVLFIAIDDLKPILGCYGDKLAKTPNIDNLARRGTIFMTNYCQQAVSGPTRASIMTGKRPDFTGIWDLQTKMRDVNPNIVSIPQYFASQGYQSAGIGKVYDPRCVDDELDVPSWSLPYFKTAAAYYSQKTGMPESGYQSPETKALTQKYRSEGKAKGLSGKELTAYLQQFAKPSVECVDVPDNAYADGANTLHAKDILAKLAKDNKPFFFAFGLSKPHLPFVAPKKYWDLYQRDEMPIAPYQLKSKNGPEIAYHTSAELRMYTDIPPLTSFSDQKVGINLPVDKQKELIHGYYASTSYTDAQVGIIMHALDSLGLLNNTIVILWGDHGWHLGDHNLWNKHTNFEQATHAPLLISAPWIKPSKTTSPTEFVDIFPTLCELSGLEIPQHLDGKSLVGMMKDPSVSVKKFSVSQYPRPHEGQETGRLGWSDGEFMGYSIRNEQYRYTIWMKDHYRSNKPFNKALMVASELYDYKKDPNETANVVDEKAYATIAKSMYDEMLGFFKSQAGNKPAKQPVKNNSIDRVIIE
jgi:iduronate 2-sulfatase